MDCYQCNYNNQEEARFCGNCGSFLAKEGDGAKSIGERQRITASLSYLLGFVSGLVVFLASKEKDYIRFHAMQSMVTLGTFTLIALVLRVFALIPSFVGVVFIVLMWAVVAIGFVSWILLMVNAYWGERFLMPWFGEFAERETYGRRYT